jgi:hypothetical protein
MQVIFESRDPEGAQLRELAVRRTSFVFRRLSLLVQRARVQLYDVNGPRGGVDKRCDVHIRTTSAGSIMIRASAGDWRSALDSALARASRVLLRTWQRGRGFERSRLTSIDQRGTAPGEPDTDDTPQSPWPRGLASNRVQTRGPLN